MIEPVRQNTISTGVDTAAGVSQTGIPPDIESTSPLAPRFIPTIFPTLVSPLQNVRTFSLLLNVFQSTDERYPSDDDVAWVIPNTHVSEL